MRLINSYNTSTTKGVVIMNEDEEHCENCGILLFEEGSYKYNGVVLCEDCYDDKV